jgi:hypothetical protein
MQLETWPLTRFILYARNPRKNDHVVDRTVASIREFGFKVPVLAEIAVILCDDWSDTQVKAFRLLMNRSVNWAEWDNELLSLELLDLKGLDFDLSLRVTGQPLDEDTQYGIHQVSARSSNQKYKS